MRVGQLLVATNRGGELHTFTEVDEFGGGIVADLNELTGRTDHVAPECTTLTGSDFVPPGGSTSEEEEEAGVEKYQCLHPPVDAGRSS
jgi:hypothetical protein